jgi:hypothetical protein
VASALPTDAAQFTVLTLLGRAQPIPRLRHLERPHVEALVILAGGLLSAASLLAFATGKTKAAYALGIAGALTGAAIGAARVFGE